jgi:4-diphosphocytidyl-2-C-methyl-D-erythritol kinase
VIRAANSYHELPFDDEHLREIAAPLGSDVPSQIVPAHSVVSGTGERVQRVELPPMALVLATAEPGLATRDVFDKAVEMGLPRAGPLRCADLHALAAEPANVIAARLENDLQPATIRLRPELAGTIEALLAAGALGAQVSGSGPTAFGLFGDEHSAAEAAAAVPGGIVTMVAGR